MIPWNDDPGVFVANALRPAQVISVDIDEEHRIANVTVPERMLSLAIGREGQNARLAARLTGWRIDIRSDVSVAEAKAAPSAKAETPATTETVGGEVAKAETNGTEAGRSTARRRRPSRRRDDEGRQGGCRDCGGRDGRRARGDERHRAGGSAREGAGQAEGADNKGRQGG